MATLIVGDLTDEETLKIKELKIKEYIERKIEDFNETIDKKIYLEAKDILNKYFGEENNQISKTTYKDVREAILYEWGDINIPLMNGFNFIQRKQLWESCNVYIRFPELTITNGVSNPHNIKDLWVRFNVNGKFGISNLSGTRSFLTYAEALVGYHHSHLPCRPQTVPEAPKFNHFCTGSGEILQSMKILALDGFDPINFTLFCLHLKNYVVWESLEGVPHITYDSLNTGIARRRISSGGNGEDAPPSLLPNLANSAIIKVTNTLKNIVSRINGARGFDYLDYIRTFIDPIIINDEVIINSTDELSIELASILSHFSDREMSEANISSDGIRNLLCKRLPNGSFTSLERPRDPATVVLPTLPIFTFKDQPIYLTIEGLEEKQKQISPNTQENNIIYAHPSITEQFCKSFNSDFTEACFNFQKAIKENSLENLLQTTGADLLPMFQNS